MTLRSSLSIVLLLATIGVATTATAQDEGGKSAPQPSVETREDLLLLTKLLNDAATRFHQTSTARTQSRTCRGCHDMGAMSNELTLDFGMEKGDIDFIITNGLRHGGGMSGNPHQKLIDLPKPNISFNAAYLPGVGVVVQGSMPEPPLQFEAIPGGSPKEKLDDWEKARRALRGIPEEKNTIRDIDIISKPTFPELAKQLASVIQRNAQRVRGLKPGDKISLAVTFSPAVRPKSSGDVFFSGWVAGGEGMGADEGAEGEGGGYPGGASPGGAGPGIPGGESGFGPGGGGHGGDFGEAGGYEEAGGGFEFEIGGEGFGDTMGAGMSGVSQGDLYLRRGDYAKAIAIFIKEIESRAKIKLNDIGKTSLQKLIPVESQLKKLSQARIATGEFDEAQAILEMIQKVSAIKEKSEQTFLRRLYLDMLGRMPTAEESKTYHSNKSPNRRQRLIEKLTTQHKQQKADAQKGRLPAQLIIAVEIPEFGGEEPQWVTNQFIPSQTLGQTDTKVYPVPKLVIPKTNEAKAGGR